MTLFPTREARLAVVSLMVVTCVACSGGDSSQNEQGPTVVTAFELPADGEMPDWSLGIATRPSPRMDTVD